MALKGKSEDTPPKQVRLTELKVSRCLRKSLLFSSVRSKVSSDSESQVIIMRVFPAVKAEASSCGQDKPFCLRCCANFSKPRLRSAESISTCSMRAIELTAKTFPFSIPMTSFITCVLCSARPHFFKTKGTFWLCASSTLRKCKTLAPQKHISDNYAKYNLRNVFES